MGASRFKTLFLAAIWPAFLCSPQLAAQVGISPPYMEIRLDDTRGTHSFRLHNFKDREISFDVRVRPWTMDEDNRLVELAPEPESLDRWIVVNPVRFTIPPGDSQVVRFGIRPAVPLEPGEHRAILFFEEDLTGEEPIALGVIRTRIRMGSAVYVHVGEITRSAEIKRVSVDGGIAAVTLTNTGTANVRLRGSYRIWNAAGDAASATEADGRIGDPLVAGELPPTPVLPGHTRTLTFALGKEEPVDLPQGEYLIELEANVGSERLSRSWPFRVDS